MDQKLFEKNLGLGVYSRWSSHNKNKIIAITNSCVAWKHGHVVAAVSKSYIFSYFCLLPWSQVSPAKTRWWNLGSNPRECAILIRLSATFSKLNSDFVFLACLDADRGFSNHRDDFGSDHFGFDHTGFGCKSFNLNFHLSIARKPNWGGFKNYNLLL